jgi:hypothetical protein
VLLFYPFVAWAKEMAAWAYGVVFDLLAAQAKEIVAMWTLTVLPALLAPVMSRSAVGMGGFVADRQWFGVGILGNDWLAGEGHGVGTLGWVFRAT